MPVFQPRNRVQILRAMIARAIARSPLVGLTRNSTIYHVLAAAAEEDSISYFEAARLRSVFSLDNATGTDLDERAAEIQPSTVERFRAIFATGDVTFSRPGTTGTLNIAVGTIIAASDDLCFWDQQQAGNPKKVVSQRVTIAEPTELFFLTKQNGLR